MTVGKNILPADRSAKLIEHVGHAQNCADCAASEKVGGQRTDHADGAIAQ